MLDESDNVIVLMETGNGIQSIIEGKETVVSWLVG